MGPKPVRLIDLARAAGVSLSTASQVMNDSGRVAPATRERVLEVAERLDYRPNALARSVASGRSHTIGILAENASGAFCMPVLVGANRALSRFNLTSVLYDAAHNSKLRREHVRELQTRHVDGIVVIGEGPDVSCVSISDQFPGPVLYAFGRSDDDEDLSFTSDGVQAGRLAAEHLLQLGRTRLLHVTAQPHFRAVRDRAQGFLEMLGERGVTPAGPVMHGEFSREWGFTAARQILEHPERCDAIFAGNDEIAIGLAAELQAGGVRVPEQIAIVGFDNAAGQADRAEPFLTSIDPRLAAVGAAAVEHLVGILSGKAEKQPVTAIACELVEGRSTVGGAQTARSLVLEALIS